MQRTLFERIIDKEIPATFEYEDEFVVAIRDIAPTAPVHILIIPRKPLRGIDAVTADDEPLVGHMLHVGRIIAERLGLADQGYRLVTNVGDHAGQTVPHLHVHLLGGEPLGGMRTRQGSGSQNRMGSALLRDAGAIVLAAVLLAVVFNASNPRSIPWVKQTIERVQATDDDLRQLLGTTEPSTPAPTESPRVAEPEPTPATVPTTLPTKAAAPEPSPKVVAVPPTFEAQPGVVKEIGYDAFVRLSANPHYLIDARTAEAFGKGHIQGAVNFYGGEAEMLVPQMLSSVPRDRVILIYCDGGECELSHYIADVLKNFKYGPIMIFTGGWAEWSKARR